MNSPLLPLASSGSALSMTRVPEPDVVYHYTSMDTLLKIVGSKSIYATGVSYLNDTQERVHFLNLVRGRLPDFLKEHPATDMRIVTPFLEEKEEKADRHIDITFEPFAASFSQASDLLPQWRSYCPNGNGVSIGFRTDCLKAAVLASRIKTGNPLRDRTPEVRFGKVEYLTAEKTHALDEAIIQAIGVAAEAVSELRNDDAQAAYEASNAFYAEIEQQACFNKDGSFSNEQEYRLLVDPVFVSYDLLEFRASKTTLIPYVEVPIPEKAARPLPRSLIEMLTSSADRTDFIDRVVIGPSPNSGLSVEAVRCFLRRHDIESAVTPSKVPYRDL